MDVKSPLIISPSKRLYIAFKLFVDWIAAALILLLLSPLLGLIAVAIRLDSPGPAIFRQERIGRNGSIFIIFKFRTMKINTPNLSTEIMQKSGLNMITRIGAILRRTSFDELPQLINILRGDMSFIGPRPALPSQTDVNTLRDKLGVHQIRNGITGLAQVMGRDDLDTPTKVGYDLEYCWRMSPLYDFSIVFRTIWAMATSRGNK
jgi:lipopolysaccharide/colanic/teichoic acid biosynthesis glycosyltransferase